MPYQREMLNTQVKLLFLHLLRYYSDSMFMAMIASDDSETIIEMMSYIQENFRDITVEKLCEKYKYSKRQIFRLIKRYAGTTLGKLQKDLRMKHAARLLTSSGLTVEQIAADCGYKSANHFYSVFKETYGFTPLEYRKNHRH
ncbi:MAG: helix-turn-helix domain-containing protein [Eubacteriales bacterium]